MYQSARFRLSFCVSMFFSLVCWLVCSAPVYAQAQSATVTTLIVQPKEPVNQPITFTANVTSDSLVSSGQVNFFDGNILLGVEGIGQNQALITTGPLSPGTHTITAVYSGSISFAASTSAPTSLVIAADGIGIIRTVAGTGARLANGAAAPSNGNEILATRSNVPNPSNVVADAQGNLFIAEEGDAQIRRVDARTGEITRIVGGPGTISPGDGGIAGSAAINGPIGLALDSKGNLYIGEVFGNRIRRVDAVTGLISTVAGDGTAGFGGDGGPAALAEINLPAGIAVDRLGNITFSDSGNQRIRTIDSGTGTISTIAGTGTQGFSGDGGPALNANFNGPIGVAFDSTGNTYVFDSGNNRVRRIDASTGIISTVVGNGIRGFAGDGGLATDAALKDGFGITFDSAGNLFIADSGNSRIRRVDAFTNIITTVAGSALPPAPALNADVSSVNFGDGGLATSAIITLPEGVFVDNSGNLFIADDGLSLIRKVPLGVPAIALSPASLTFGNQRVGTQSTAQAIAVTNNGSALLELGSILATPGYAASGTCGSSLDPGASCQLSVVFSPTAQGQQNGVISFAANVSPNPVTLQVTGTGTAAVADTNPPVIRCAAPDGLWHAADVTLACTAQDAGSGLANTADASFILTTNVPTGTEVANATTNTRNVCDNAGNCTTTGPISGIMIDKKAPAISVISPAQTNYLVNQTFLSNYACTDDQAFYHAQELSQAEQRFPPQARAPSFSP